MRTLTIYLTTESPLAIRADHSTTGAGTIDYIPGSSFVGGWLPSIATCIQKGQNLRASF